MGSKRLSQRGRPNHSDLNGGPVVAEKEPTANPPPPPPQQEVEVEENAGAQQQDEEQEEEQVEENPAVQAQQQEEEEAVVEERAEPDEPQRAADKGAEPLAVTDRRSPRLKKATGGKPSEQAVTSPPPHPKKTKRRPSKAKEVVPTGEAANPPVTPRRARRLMFNGAPVVVDKEPTHNPEDGDEAEQEAEEVAVDEAQRGRAKRSKKRTKPSAEAVSSPQPKRARTQQDGPTGEPHQQQEDGEEAEREDLDAEEEEAEDEGGRIKKKLTWPAADEICILDALAVCGTVPDYDPFYENLVGLLELESCTIGQLKDKVRSLRRRFIIDTCKGVVPREGHKRRKHDISKTIWGNEVANAAAAHHVGNSNDVDVESSEEVLPNPRTGWEKICQRYPFLAAEVMALEPAERGMFKRALLRMRGRMLRALEPRVKKFRLARLKLETEWRKIKDCMIKAAAELL